MVGEHGSGNYSSFDNSKKKSYRDGAIPPSHNNHLGRMELTGVIFTHVKTSRENLIRRLLLRQPLTRKPPGAVAQPWQKTTKMDNPEHRRVTGHIRTVTNLLLAYNGWFSTIFSCTFFGFVSVRMLVLCHLECWFCVT